MSRQKPGISNPLCKNPGAIDLPTEVTARMIASPETAHNEARRPDILRRTNRNPAATPATNVGSWKSGKSNTNHRGIDGTKYQTAGGNIAQTHIRAASATSSASRRVRTLAAIHGN